MIDPLDVPTQKVSALAKFDRDELLLGSVVGQGAFGRVFNVREINLRSTSDNNIIEVDNVTNDEALHLRVCISNQCRSPSGNFNYVAKLILPYAIRDVTIKAFVDEIQLLSSLAHCNIIKISGLPTTGPINMVDKNIFFMMEKLEETLERKIENWSRLSKKLLNKILRQGKIYFAQLKAGKELASAMSYIHSKNIIYRDLKPKNIGFCAKGCLKIFDFGLARDLSKQRLTDGKYNLTGLVGSLQYMAPEVLLKKPYNMSADVYSFGLVLWQIFSLKRPNHNQFYGGSEISIDCQIERVLIQREKPPLKGKIPSSIYKIICDSWSIDSHLRPNFEYITLGLQQEVKYEEMLKERKKSFIPRGYHRNEFKNNHSAKEKKQKIRKARRRMSFGHSIVPD